MVNQDVLPGERGEDVGVLRQGRLGWDERRVLQLGQVLVGDHAQAGQVERPGQVVDRAVVDPKLGDQLVEHVAGDGVLHLQPDRGLEAALLQFPLQRLHQVLGDVLVHLEITGAGDPEHMVLQDVQAGEQLGEVRGDHVFQRHEPVLGHGEEPGQQWRHLDPGEHGRAGARVGDHHGQAQRQAGNVGEGVGRVHQQRRQHRVDPLAEQPVQVLLLTGGQFLPTQDLDALVGQGGQDRVAEAFGVPDAQLAGGFQGVGEDLPGREPAGPLHRQPGGHPADPPRDPDHEEFIQVAGEDRQEPHALKQRHAVVLGEFEYPLVEAEPALLAIEEPPCREFHCFCARRWCARARALRPD